MVWLFLFAAFGAFLVAIGQIFYLKHSKNRVAFFMYLCMGYILVYFKMAFDLTMVDYGHLYLTGNIAGIAAGCLIYYHVRSVSDEGFVFGWRHGLIIVGCIAAYALPLCPFWVLDGRQKGELLRKMITSGYLYWDEPQLAGISVFKLSNTVFAINSVAFIGLATLRLVRSIDGGRVWRNFYFYLSLIIGIGFIATLIGSYGAWVGSVFLIELLGGVLGACIFGFYLVGQAFPWALYERKLEQEAAEPTASRTRLKDEDRVRIAAKLDILLNQERLYRRSDLTLSALAVAVGVTPHQLSEYLNRFEKKRFTAFLNNYRIEEAKRLFIADPKTNNIIVARETGFNSDTHFHFVFQGVAGISPGEFRRTCKSPKIPAGL
ncbi:MAG: AraC family transcriptional regulator [Spirochaetes bacterium]|nr:AraC family transcriptional regulator [Spirochaetota bacterium]MBX3723225.1 AraC family transcriptional regulator [Turneriella sp.]